MFPLSRRCKLRGYPVIQKSLGTRLWTGWFLGYVRILSIPFPSLFKIFEVCLVVHVHGVMPEVRDATYLIGWAGAYVGDGGAEKVETKELGDMLCEGQGG